MCESAAFLEYFHFPQVFLQKKKKMDDVCWILFGQLLSWQTTKQFISIYMQAESGLQGRRWERLKHFPMLSWKFTFIYLSLLDVNITNFGADSASSLFCPPFWCHVTDEPPLFCLLIDIKSSVETLGVGSYVEHAAQALLVESVLNGIFY